MIAKSEGQILLQPSLGHVSDNSLHAFLVALIHRRLAYRPASEHNLNQHEMHPYTVYGWLGLGKAKIGAIVKASFKLLNASSVSILHS